MPTWTRFGLNQTESGYQLTCFGLYISSAGASKETHVVHARSAASQPPASKPGQVPRNPHVVFPSDSERIMAERFVRTPVPVGAGPRMGFVANSGFRAFAGEDASWQPGDISDVLLQTHDAASTRICVFPHV